MKDTDREIEILQALADPTRLRLLNLLMQAVEICVCELVDALRIPQYKVSRHLGILAAAGWVEDRRRGKWIYYRMARNLRPYQETFLKALRQMHEEREDFRQDEARATCRLETRSGGVCCVGLIAKIGKAGHRIGGFDLTIENK